MILTIYGHLHALIVLPKDAVQNLYLYMMMLNTLVLS